MSSPKKESRMKKTPHDMLTDEFMREINKLNSLLQDKLRIEHDTEEQKYQSLLKKMTGHRIWITLQGDPLYGMEQSLQVLAARARSPCVGGSKLQLGSKHIKQRPVFKLLPLESSSEEAQPVIDIGNRTPMSRVIMSPMTTTACVYHGYNSVRRHGVF